MTEIATNDPLNRNLADQVRHYRHGADQLAQPLGRTPTYEERRAALGVRDERRLQALEAWADYQVNQESGHYGTVFPDWDEDLEDWGVTQAVAYAAGRSPRAANPPYEVTVFTLFQEQLQAALAPLPPLEQQVIRVHYYLEESLPQIAREVGLSRQTISHRHQQALASLYQILMERGYGPDSLPDHWAGAFF